MLSCFYINMLNAYVSKIGHKRPSCFKTIALFHFWTAEYSVKMETVTELNSKPFL